MHMVIVQSSSSYMMNLGNLFRHFQKLLVLDISLCLHLVYPAEKKSITKLNFIKKVHFFVNKHQINIKSNYLIIIYL